MNILLVGEYRQGKLLGNLYEQLAFAAQLGAEPAVFLVGEAGSLPRFPGRLYLADVATYGEYNPTRHKDLLLEAIRQEQPSLLVFSHSSYGWDLAPRLALALGATQISEVTAVVDGGYIVPACNSKLRRRVESQTSMSVITLQSGAFTAQVAGDSMPTIIHITSDKASPYEFKGYEAASSGGIDLSKAAVIVSAGRGIGKPENVALVSQLAAALKGEYGASRPVVDAQWVEHHRQVGTTGQSVAPKLYMACGISGAIQHLAGMKKSEFVVAVNTDKDAPIGEIADVLVVADLKQFLPVLTEKLRMA
jgi:electron transfer flavoprotein alpha subunit